MFTCWFRPLLTHAFPVAAAAPWAIELPSCDKAGLPLAESLLCAGRTPFSLGISKCFQLIFKGLPVMISLGLTTALRRDRSKCFVDGDRPRCGALPVAAWLPGAQS